MAKFKVGDKVRVKFGSYDFKGTIYGEPTRDAYGLVYPVKTDAGRLVEEVDEKAITANSVAANAIRNASAFEIGVGDKVKVGGKDGEVTAKYFGDGKIHIDVKIGGKIVSVEPKDVVKNAVARNAVEDGTKEVKILLQKIKTLKRECEDVRNKLRSQNKHAYGGDLGYLIKGLSELTEGWNI